MARPTKSSFPAVIKLIAPSYSTEPNRPVLLIAAEDQNPADREALAAAIRRKDSVTLAYREVQTDHSFSDHRIALQTIVLEWLAELNKPAPPKKP